MVIVIVLVKSGDPGSFRQCTAQNTPKRGKDERGSELQISKYLNTVKQAAVCRNAEYGDSRKNRGENLLQAFTGHRGIDCNMQMADYIQTSCKGRRREHD